MKGGREGEEGERRVGRGRRREGGGRRRRRERKEKKGGESLSVGCFIMTILFSYISPSFVCYTHTTQANSAQ